MSNPIQAKVFQGKNTVALAQWLLGKVLVRQRSESLSTRHVITEVEAYHSERDLACHASKGRTARTEVLYRGGGHWYVYLCYGIHEMLNLVVGPDGFPAAILIRAVHDVIGPGRLTKTLNINRELNGVPAEIGSGLWIEDEGIVIPRGWIQRTPRIGVDYAGPIWSAKPWRFTFDPTRLPRAEHAATTAPPVA